MIRRYPRLVLASAGALVTLVAFVLLRGSGAEPIQITTAEVTTGAIARRIMVTGTLQPMRTVAIGSRISGTIQSIESDFNDIVQAGQIVARLDPSLYEARMIEAEARLAQMRSDHARLQVIADDAHAKLARSEALAVDHLIPAAELDLARLTAKDAAAALKAAAAGVVAMQATVAEARLSLSHTIIRSPIAGIVVSRDVDVGQTVAASVQTPILFTVADLRRMQLLAEIAEADVGGVRPGSKVSFQVESIGDQPFEGTVSAVRLQPVLEVAAASGSGAGSGTPAPTGTSGTSASSAGSSSATQQAGTGTTGASGTQTTSPTISSAGSSSGASVATPSQTSQAGGASGGVVTYTAVIDVNNAEGTVPPGGTAIVTLAGYERQDVVRIPNNALAFRPSAEAFAGLGQEPPPLDPPQLPRESSTRNARRAYVWKLENRRFVPIAVEAGLSDDAWTELVDGPLRPGDVLLTAAEPAKK